MNLLLNTGRLGSALAATALSRARRGPLLPGWPLRAEALFLLARRVMDSMAALDAPAQRARFESMLLPSPLLRKVQITQPAEAGAPRGEWITPLEGPTSRTLLFIHGGGFVVGSPRYYRDFAARLGLAMGARVFSLDYRLAPEAPFPSAPEEAAAALRWLVARGDAQQLTLAGDSAGAVLCLTSLIAQRDAGLPMPAAAALICPWPDLAMTAGSIVENERTDVFGQPLVRRWLSLYLGGHDPKDPRASPLHAELRGLPKLLVQVGGAEMARDDASALAERARAAGVEVTLEVAPRMPHVWHLFAALLPEGRAAIARVAQFLRDATP